MDIKGKRLFWGATLAWGSFLVLHLPGLVRTFRDISAQKATGLGAVAAGISEAYFTFGVVAAVVLQFIAITLLVRSFSKGRPLRALLSLAALACSSFVLFATGFSLWLLYRLPRG